MKKLQGLKKGFSAFENKQLLSQNSILGGRLLGSNDNWTTESCNEQTGQGDVSYWTDGIKVKEVSVG